MSTIVVLGATGLIGKALANILESAGHKVVRASKSTGVDIISGVGLAEACRGATAIIDVTNSPSFDTDIAHAFFQASTTNIIHEAKTANVSHVVILSVVGARRFPEFGHMAAKVMQEEMIKESRVPYTIVQATQFFEFISSIAETGRQGDGTIHASTREFQPIAADDISTTLAKIVLEPPINGAIELCGPEKMSLEKAVKIYLDTKGKGEEVKEDEEIGYFGTPLASDELLPQREDPVLGSTLLAEWLDRM